MAMRWMKRWPYLAEATDGTEGGASGGAEGQATEQQPVDIAAGMLAEIEKAHTGGSSDAQQTDAGAGATSATGERPRDEAGRFIRPDPAAATAGAQQGAPAATLLGPDGKPIGQEQQKPKSADDFALSEEEKKTLTPKARERYQTLVEHVKTKDAELERLSTENAGLAQARDAIMGVLTEHKIEAPDLTAFADFNLKVKTGDLEGALQVVDAYRAQLLDALGRDAPGFDPLDKPEHADLKQRVDALQLSREDALQIVKSRRVLDAQQQQQNHQQQAQRGQQDVQRAQNQGLDAVKAWNARIAADVDYEGKASKILPLLEGIVQKYPPHLWVPTLETLWATTAAPAPQQQQQGVRSPQPLRPSGAQGGNPAPKSMLEALEAGLPHSY